MITHLKCSSWCCIENIGATLCYPRLIWQIPNVILQLPNVILQIPNVILQIPNVYCKYPMYTANTQYIKLLRVNTQFHKKLICFCDFFYTFAYGAKKSRAVMCNLNFPVFVNFPNVVPKLIRLGRAMCSAFFIRSSL